MTEQHDPQADQRPTAPGLSVEDLETEREVLDRSWAEFSQARAGLAEVMSDDELRAFGINVEVLDERL